MIYNQTLENDLIKLLKKNDQRGILLLYRLYHNEVRDTILQWVVHPIMVNQILIHVFTRQLQSQNFHSLETIRANLILQVEKVCKRLPSLLLENNIELPPAGNTITAHYEDISRHFRADSPSTLLQIIEPLWVFPALDVEVAASNITLEMFTKDELQGIEAIVPIDMLFNLPPHKTANSQPIIQSVLQNSIQIWNALQEQFPSKNLPFCLIVFAHKRWLIHLSRPI